MATGLSYAAAVQALQGLRVNGRLVLAGIDPAEPFTIPPGSHYPFFAQGQKTLDCGIRVLYIDELLHLTGVVVVEAEPLHVAGYRRRAGSGIVRRDVRRQAARVRQHPRVKHHAGVSAGRLPGCPGCGAAGGGS